nr:MAP3K7 C-terminal-like protein [Jaculus jaculus]
MSAARRTEGQKTSVAAKGSRAHKLDSICCQNINQQHIKIKFKAKTASEGEVLPLARTGALRSSFFMKEKCKISRSTERLAYFNNLIQKHDNILAVGEARKGERGCGGKRNREVPWDGTLGSEAQQVAGGALTAVSAPQMGSGCYVAGAAWSLAETVLHKGDDWPERWLALDYTSADTQPSELEDPGEDRASGAHMISTASVPADKPVRIAFSLNDTPEDTPSEDAIPLVFPELDLQLQPLPPCQDSVESMQVFKQHCQIAEEYHEVKREIALLEERKKELIAKLDQAEKEKVDAAQLVREFEALTEENQTLKMAQSQCVEQLEKLRIQYQKRQGSS